MFELALAYKPDAARDHAVRDGQLLRLGGEMAYAFKSWDGITSRDDLKSATLYHNGVVMVTRVFK